MRAVMKKLLLAALFVSVMAVTFCGCREPNVTEANLKSVPEAKKYVSEKYPPATVKTTKIESDQHVFTFEDDLCGFTFEVKSYAVKREMEGLDLGTKEKTTDTWNASYCQYIEYKLSQKTNDLKKTMGFEFEYYEGLDSDVFMAVITDKPVDEIESSVKEIADIIKAEDKHGKLTDKEIWCWNGEKDYDRENLIGRYSLSEDKMLDKKTIADKQDSDE